MPHAASGLFDVRSVGIIDNHKIYFAADVDSGFGAGVENKQIIFRGDGFFFQNPLPYILLMAGHWMLTVGHAPDADGIASFFSGDFFQTLHLGNAGSV